MNILFPRNLFAYLKTNRRFLGILCCLMYFSCQSSQTEAMNVKPTQTGSEVPSELRVLTYNLYMRPPQLFFWNKQKKRTKLLPRHLGEYDVIVFEEVFMNKNRKKLLKALQSQYPYQTKPVGKDKFIKQDGGVVLISRWPIEKEAQQLYEACAGSDCMATKGAVYARINKLGAIYHLFGTHTQASEKHRYVREQQFTQLRSFIDEQEISATEAVLIAGDMNVDRFSGLDTGEFPRMLEVLAASHPRPEPGPDYPPTLDGSENQFVPGQGKEYLDYVLYSNRHLQPGSSFNQVMIFREEGLDLSDHYAVYGFFSF